MGPDSLIPLGCGTRNAALLFTPPPLAVAAQLVALQEYAEHAQRYELPPSVLFLCSCLMCKTFVSLFALLFSLMFVFSVCTYSFFLFTACFFFLTLSYLSVELRSLLLSAFFFLSLPRFPMPPACTVPLFPTLSHRQPQLEGFHCSFFVSFYCLCSPFLLCCLPLLLTVCFFLSGSFLWLAQKNQPKRVSLCAAFLFFYIVSFYMFSLERLFSVLSRGLPALPRRLHDPSGFSFVRTRFLPPPKKVTPKN